MRIVRMMLTTVALLACTTCVTPAGQVDFDNFTYPWSELGGGVPVTWRWLDFPPTSRVGVVDGIHHFYDPGDTEFERGRAPYVKVWAITSGDLDGDGIDDAVVSLFYSTGGTGGTANWIYLYVYKLGVGTPKLLARMEAGSRADGGLVKVEIRRGLLILDFADAKRRIGDCCSEGFIRVRYRWKDGRFVEEGARETGDLSIVEHHTDVAHD